MEPIVTDETAQQMALILVEQVNNDELGLFFAQAQMAKTRRDKVRAQLMLAKQNPQKSAALREAWAVSQPEYLEAADYYADAQAVVDAMKLRSKDCETVLSVWQTSKRSASDFDRRMS